MRRLKKLISEISAEHSWNEFDKLTTGWEIKLSISPDAELIKSDIPVVTSDSVILDKCKSWINLAYDILTQRTENPKIVDLSLSEREQYKID